MHHQLSRPSRLIGAIGLTVASSLVSVVAVGGDASATTRIAPGERRCFEVEGTPGDVAVVNLTPVLAAGSGNGKLLPSSARPDGPVSNVNFGPSTVDPNVAFTKIGDDGLVCFNNSHHSSVDLIADQLGTITDPSFTYQTGGYSPGGGPHRVLDTRTTGAKVGPSDRRCFEVPGDAGWGTLVNLTPVLADGFGNGQLVMNDDELVPPTGSNVNYGPNTVDPNIGFAQVGSSTAAGVCYVNSLHTSVHVIADSLGSLSPSSFTMADAASGTSIRALDTRSGPKIGPSERRCFAVSGDPGDAALINLTPVLANGFGDGQVVSSDVTDPPAASNVNFGPNTVDPNLTIATIGTDGEVCYVNSHHTSLHLIADHLATLNTGAYTPAQSSGAPRRVLDTRKGDDMNGTTCDPSYPTVCIPPPPPDLDCGDIDYTDFEVVGADPHGFDRDRDGIGCETASAAS